MKIIEYAKLYKKVKEYSNGKHWIDLYNLWKLRNLDAELKEALLGREIEEFCIGECGSEFTAYVGDDLVTADSQEDFIEKCK